MTHVEILGGPRDGLVVDVPDDAVTLLIEHPTTRPCAVHGWHVVAALTPVAVELTDDGRHVAHWPRTTPNPTEGDTP